MVREETGGEGGGEGGDGQRVVVREETGRGWW